MEFKVKVKVKGNKKEFENYSDELVIEDYGVVYADDILGNAEWASTLDDYSVNDFDYIIEETDLPVSIEGRYDADAFDKIADVLYELQDKDEEDLASEYADEYPDETIYPIEMLEEDLSRLSPMQIFELGRSAEYYSADDYFKYDGYGNVVTLSDSKKEELENEMVSERIKQMFG